MKHIKGIAVSLALFFMCSSLSLFALHPSALPVPMLRQVYLQAFGGWFSASERSESGAPVEAKRSFSHFGPS